MWSYEEMKIDIIKCCVKRPCVLDLSGRKFVVKQTLGERVLQKWFTMTLPSFLCMGLHNTTTCCPNAGLFQQVYGVVELSRVIFLYGVTMETV